MPFSLSLDTGVKGRRKRTEVSVRYYSDEKGFERVVERLIFTIRSSHETASHVADSLLKRFMEAKVDIATNLVSLQMDSCSVMRGKKTGLLKRISNVATSVMDCDVGGDGLHHVHNAEKKAFKEIFPEVIKLLENVKFDIGKSPGKIEDYIAACKVVGDKPVIPTSYCISRFLDRYEAIQDTIDHIDSLIEYYKEAKIPRKRTGIKDDVKKYKLEDDLEEEDNSDEDFRGNPAARVQYMKRILDDDHIVGTELQLVVSLSCLKSGYDFLRIVQGKEVKIHLLYQAYRDLLFSVLCQPQSLKNSRGEVLSGKELKFLKLETEEERKVRRRQETVVKVQKKKSEFFRHGVLREEKDCLLSKAVREEVTILVQRYNIPGRMEKMLEEARRRRYKFLVELAKALQHYLPLDKDFLQWLKFICPKYFLESDESEEYLVKIALSTPGVCEEDVDDLRQEIRILKGKRKEVFEENLEDYIVNIKYGYKKVKGSNPVESIDQVWAPVLKNEDFPVLAEVLRSTISIFHATASVEGAVNITRNIMGDRSHRLTDSNLEARKIMKSSLKEAPSNCCYDFKVSQNHHSNWKKANEEWKKSNETGNKSLC